MTGPDWFILGVWFGVLCAVGFKLWMDHWLGPLVDREVKKAMDVMRKEHK